jgi:endoglucanase
LNLYNSSLHTFNVLRSGVQIDDPVTGIHHAASHTRDAVLAGTVLHRDLTGGWYNAGDYGKWPMMTAIAVSYMLDLYGQQERVSQSLKRIGYLPDPELLGEAQWGLSWLLKMQDPDGGVRQKVDGATQASLAAAWGEPPELDPNLRIAAPASTGSTADFAAVMYQAAHFFEARDRKKSHRLHAAADRAWNWVTRHPDVAAHDIFYSDHDSTGEFLWASLEHAVAYDQDSSELAQKITARQGHEVSWIDPSLLGLYDVAFSLDSPLHLREATRTVILQQASGLAKASAERPFHVALGEHDYVWGSAERLLHRAALFLMANALSPSPLFHQAASDQLDWILGNNALHHSFVASFGTNPVRHPWHWTYRDYGIVMPGWAVGGPNGFSPGVDPALKAIQQQGTPPARCYVDLCSREGSWASNEGQISEEAALVFVTGMLSLTSRTIEYALPDHH